MSASKRKSRTVDRVALTAIFAAAVLILTMFALSARSALQPIPAAVSIALSGSVGSDMSAVIPTRPRSR